MAQVKASKNKAENIETPTEEKKFIDTSSKEPTEITLKKKLQELIKKLHVNQDKFKGLSEQAALVKQEGIELVGAIKQFEETIKELEQ